MEIGGEGRKTREFEKEVGERVDTSERGRGGKRRAREREKQGRKTEE